MQYRLEVLVHFFQVFCVLDPPLVFFSVGGFLFISLLTPVFLRPLCISSFEGKGNRSLERERERERGTLAAQMAK